jgi:hypothetical protein
VPRRLSLDLLDHPAQRVRRLRASAASVGSVVYRESGGSAASVESAASAVILVGHRRCPGRKAWQVQRATPEIAASPDHSRPFLDQSGQEATPAIGASEAI